MNDDLIIDRSIDDFDVPRVNRFINVTM